MGVNTTRCYELYIYIDLYRVKNCTYIDHGLTMIDYGMKVWLRCLWVATRVTEKTPITMVKGSIYHIAYC